MELTAEVCRNARLSRDSRFDGKFFTGVTTTRIYCRPICPARPPKEQNVIYYRSAAAAAAAGLRPCLRCRPECAPGTPAWTGTSSTVARALRKIANGSVESGGLERLSERLGVSVRHLRRLFMEHLGASPIAVAQTQRLLSAKRLIDQTHLPLTTIAMVSGYGSIRRFNDAFTTVYGCSPREMRRGAAQTGAPGEPYEIPLRYRPPFDWQALLGFLSARAIPGIERVDGSAYRRSVVMSGHAGWLEASAKPDRQEIVVAIQFPDPSHLLRIVRRVRRMFDLDADPLTIEAHLGKDSLLSALIPLRPGVRVPGAWDGFEITVRAILGQQVSVAGATTLAGRLVERFGNALTPGAPGLTHTFPSAEQLAEADIAAIGLPRKRAEAIREFARRTASGEISFEDVIDADAFRQTLCEVPGIGDWTAQYVALRALGEPDAFPSGDLVLVRAVGVKTPNELERLSEAWRPWRAYAALHLWQGVRDGTLG